MDQNPDRPVNQSVLKMIFRLASLWGGLLLAVLAFAKLLGVQIGNH